MKIIIAGAGKVGDSLARQLASEDCDLTLIDNKPGVLAASVERYDAMTVQGNRAARDVLLQAGVEEADLLIAVTVAVIIVLAMNLVGSLLISALVIFPALSAMRVFKSFRSVTICSADCSFP